MRHASQRLANSPLDKEKGMFDIFSNTSDTTKLKKQIEQLKMDVDDAEEMLANEQQGRAVAEQRMTAMIKIRDPIQMDAVVAKLADLIEDTYARGWEGGVQERKRSIQRLIKALIETTLNGGSPS